MDFFDKLGGFAKSAGDKTSDFFKTATDRADDMIEIGKLKNKLAAAKKACEEGKLKLGDYYYQKPHDLSGMDETERSLYAAIHEAENEATALLEAIEKIKAENQAPAQEQPPVRTEAAAAAPAPKFCSSCGAPLAPGTAFCGQCGAKV